MSPAEIFARDFLDSLKALKPDEFGDEETFDKMPEAGKKECLQFAQGMIDKGWKKGTV